MKIRNKLLSLVVAMLAGCCFFGTCVEAKPKMKKYPFCVIFDNVKMDEDLERALKRNARDEKVAGDFVKYIKWSVFARKNGLVTEDEFKGFDKKFYKSFEEYVKEANGRSSEFKSGKVSLNWYFDYNSWKKFLKKHSLVTNKTKIDDMDEKVKKAFEAYVKDKYNGSVDCCFVVEGDGFTKLICGLKFGIGSSQWEETVKNAIKKLNGGCPFKDGAVDVKELLAEGCKSPLEIVDNMVKRTGKRDSIYSEKFVKLLADEFGVGFEEMDECMSVGDTFDLNSGKRLLTKKALKN